MARGKNAEAAKAAGNEEPTEAKAAPVSKKDPKPEGYVSPVEFAKLYSCAKAGVEPTLENYAELDDSQQVRPQIIYGYLRNNDAFADAAVETNTDDHLMVNVSKGLAFLVARDKARAVKAEAKEADAAKASAAE